MTANQPQLPAQKPGVPELLSCPFCGEKVQFRKALWPSDGNVDAIIHAQQTDCGLSHFSTDTADESVIAVRNRRAVPPTQPAAPDLVEAAADICGEIGLQSDAAKECASKKIAWEDCAVACINAIRSRLRAHGPERKPEVTEGMVQAGVRAMVENIQQFFEADRKIVRTILTAAHRTQADTSDGWLPIESAPTNEAVLVFVQNSEHYGSGIYRAILCDMGSGRRWHSCGLHVGRDIPAERTPTHWRPLPAPPRAQPGSGEVG